MESGIILCTTLLIEKSPQALPLGAACIASAIKNDSRLNKDFKVELTVFSKEDKEYLECLKQADSEKAFINIYTNALLKKMEGYEETKRIVCFSVFVWNRTILEKISAELRKHKVFTIAGGPEVTASPNSFIDFDCVNTGEGEVLVPEIINNYLNGKSGIETVNRNLCSLDVASLNSPYLDGTLDPADYGGALWELARGCPFKCSYCYESKGEKKVRLFPLERIEKELDLFATKKIPQVFVLDPTYNASKKRALEMLNLIAKKTPDTFYYFEARGEFLDREMARAFTKIPCALQIGLQSADEEVLKQVNRPFNKKQFVKNIGFLNEEGVIFGLDLIYGLPGESLKGFKEGVDFAISLYPNNLEIFCLSVLPGTDLFERAQELKLTFDPNPPYNVIHTDRFSEADKEIAAKIAKGCLVFYNEGRAVPWFNSVCHCLKIKPSQFFLQFGEFLLHKGNQVDCNSHTSIEKLQLEFLDQLINQKNLVRFKNLIQDLVIFNGALSRTQDTGKKEIVKLTYDAEYLASQYATDLQYFVQNVRPKSCRVETFKNKGYADFKVLKK